MNIPLHEAQSSLADLIHGLAAGDEIIITENDQPVALIVPAESIAERQCGTLRGTVLYMAPDFDAPLEDFREYME